MDYYCQCTGHRGPEPEPIKAMALSQRHNPGRPALAWAPMNQGEAQLAARGLSKTLL